MQKIATIFKDFSRTPFDFQGPPTRKISPRFVYKCTFQVQANRTLRLFFKNMQILKFKSQLMFAFFTAVNHFSGLLRKQVYFKRFERSLFLIRNYWKKQLLWRQLLNFRVCMFLKSTVRLGLFAPPVSLHFSVHLS